MRPQAPYLTNFDRDLAGVVAWRRRRLKRAGFDPTLADALAADRRADLHALIELVDRGCPPTIAARILAPLDSQHGPPE
jgi:hypothetical protein